MGGYAYADDNPATHADPTGLLLPSEGGGCPSTDPGCPGNTSTDPTTPASPPGPPAAASPPGTPASPGGCGFLGLTCTAHFLTDAWHGVTSTATGLATSILQPLRDAQSCLTGSTTGCQNTALFLLASPLYALKNTITATITTGHAIYHEFTTGHPGQAIGTIATLILIAALAKKLAPTAGPAAADELPQAAQGVRDALNVGSRRNVAVADYRIDGQSGRLASVSGQATRPGTVDATCLPSVQFGDRTIPETLPWNINRRVKWRLNLVGEVASILDRLVDEHLVPQEALRGCSTAEVKAVMADQDVARLPLSYLCYLRKIGRGAGEFLRGTDAFYPGIIGLKSATIDLLAENDVATELVPNAFVFAMHQGYQAFWFPSIVQDNPEVIMYQEGDKFPSRTWANFATYLGDMIKDIDRR